MKRGKLQSFPYVVSYFCFSALLLTFLFSFNFEQHSAQKISWKLFYKRKSDRLCVVCKCGDSRHISSIFAAAKFIVLTYKSTGELDHRVSQVWRPRRRINFKVVLSIENCYFYETHNHAEGRWHMNSSHIFLHKKTRTLALRRRLNVHSNKFEWVSKSDVLCCPERLKSFRTPLHVAYYTAKSKIYDKVLMNFPVMRHPGCGKDGKNDLIVWSILPRPINTRSRSRKRSGLNQLCSKSFCFDEWIPILASADVFVFELTSKPDWKVIRNTFPEQIWVGVSGENWMRDKRHNFLRNEHDYWKIQMRADWRMTSDLPATFLSAVYFGSKYVDFYRDFSRSYSKIIRVSRLKSVAVVLSNCGAPSGRDDIVLELSKYYSVVSYGECYTNLWPSWKKIAENSKLKGSYDTSFKQKTVLEEHMFAFAIPNVIEVDWIEEKLFSALHAGVIPIIMSNALDFLPCSHCAIFVDHFSSVYEMSTYLQRIAHNKTLYAQYHKWRVNFDIKAHPGFEMAYKGSVDTLPCRLSEVLRPGSCPPSCDSAQRRVAHAAVHRLQVLQRFW